MRPDKSSVETAIISNLKDQKLPSLVYMLQNLLDAFGPVFPVMEGNAGVDNVEIPVPRYITAAAREK